MVQSKTEALVSFLEPHYSEFKGVKMNILTDALLTLGSAKAGKLIDDYINSNKLEFFCVAWDYQEADSLLILKINLWFDKASGVLSSVYLSDRVENKYIYSTDDYFTGFLNEFQMPKDLSLEISVLCNFDHYIEKIMNISLEDPKALSFVFKGVSKNFRELDLVFKLGKKLQTIKLSQLIEEVPTIIQFAEQRGHKEYIDSKIKLYNSESL